MTSTKHTPGPWIRHTVVNGITRQTHPAIFQESAVDLLGHICDAPLMVFDMNGIPSANDADLVAASPELLAALIAILQETDEASPGAVFSTDSYLPQQFIEQARAAVAKAGGTVVARPGSAQLPGRE